MNGSQSGTTGDEDGRNVEAQRGVEHPGSDLVTVSQQHQAIETMSFSDRLNHVGNQFAGRQRVVHPFVAHGDPIADAGNTEDKGVATSGVDTFFDETLQIAHAGVAGDQIGKGGRNADKGLVHLLVRHTGTFQQCPVGSALKTLGDCIAALAAHMGSSCSVFSFFQQKIQQRA